jgi:hypothetical protein
VNSRLGAGFAQPEHEIIAAIRPGRSSGSERHLLFISAPMTAPECARIAANGPEYFCDN